MAPLVGGLLGVCPGSAWAQGETPARYETVVVAPPVDIFEPREDSAAAASVVTEDRTPRAGESVTQILSEQAGVSVTRLGGMGSVATISLRGSTANQVLVYVDGVPLGSVTGGGVDVGAIPLGDVDRIEVYRGTSPIGFGASGIGGVVSLTTAVPDGNRLELNAGGGSFGTYLGDVRASSQRGAVHVYGGLHGFVTEGDFPYVNDNGTSIPEDDVAARRRNNDLRQLSALTKVTVDLSERARLFSTLAFFAREQGLPGPGTLQYPRARLGTLRETATLGYDASGACGMGHRLRILGFANQEVSHFRDPAHQINATSSDALDRTVTAGATLDGRRTVAPWLALSGVLNGRYDRFRPSESYGVVLTGQPATRWFGAAGIEADSWVHAIGLEAIASARVEVARQQTSGRDPFGVFLPTSSLRNDVLPIARLSLVQTIAPWLSARANAGRYARLPSTVELYGNTGYLVGNPSLAPEHGINADIGPVLAWRRASFALEWSTAAFGSAVTDLIRFRYGNGRARPENIGSARVLGIESSLVSEIGRHLRMVASATFTDARDTSDVAYQNDRQLPLRPRYHLYARPELRRLGLGRRSALGFYAEVDATAGNFRDPANLDPVGARLLFGAGLYLDLPANVRLRVSGKNLGDARINDLAGYPLPGREVYLSLAWSTDTTQAKEPMP